MQRTEEERAEHDSDDALPRTDGHWWPEPSWVTALWSLGWLLRRVLRTEQTKDEAPAFSGRTWTELAALAGEHLLEGTLHEAVEGLPPGLMPPADVRAHLAEAHRRHLFENVRLKHELLALLRGLQDAGVDPVVLKGGTVLLAGAPRALRVRGMHDLDVLVSPDERTGAHQAMVAMGYRPDKMVDRPTHADEYSSPDRLGGVDLHHELGRPSLRRVLSTEVAVAGSVTQSIDGLTYRALNPTHAVIHNIAHAQLHDFNHHVASTPVRQLFTYAALVTEFADRVAWDEVRAKFAAAGQTRILEDHAELARRLFAVTTPVPSKLHSRAHYARCLAAFAAPALSDVPRNLAYAFGSAYLHERYGDGSVTLLRVRHARQLWSDRDTSRYEQSMVRRTA